MTRKPLGLAALAVAAALFFAVNIAAAWGLRGWRVDFTADRLHTLSRGTLDTLAALKEPVSLKFFFSAKLADQIPQFKAYGARVRELLETYAARSGGKVAVEVIDPIPFSEAEDGAVQAGVQGVPIDSSSGRQFYFGLQGIGAGDRREVVSFFAQERERFLEYDLTRLIQNLGQAAKPKVAVIGDAPLEFGPGGVMAAMRGQGRPYMVLQQLRQTFDVTVLGADTAEVGDDVAVLVVARPASLSSKALYAVDQFALRKGRVLALVDPAAESGTQAGPGGGPMAPRAEMPELLAAWGVEMESGRFVADRRFGLPVETGEGATRRVIPHPGWLGLGDAAINRDDVVTAELAVVNVGSAGSLKKREGSEVSFTPLLLSSPDSATMEVEKLGAQPDPEGIMRALKPAGARHVLAARVAGRIKTAYPNGAPPEPAPEKKDDAKADEKKDDAAKPEAEKKPEEAKPARPHLAESAVPANIIVVADSDLLEDRFWTRVRDFLGQQVSVPFASNGDFVVNAVDNLAGSDDLIRLRSRGISYRPFAVVEDLRRDAAERFLARRDELQRALEDTEKRLNELQERKKPGAAAALTAEEESAIEKFRDEMVRIRRQLREVQHGLERDIETLAAWLKVINIGLVPMGVLVVAGLIALARKHRRRIRVPRD